ncbi:hypothetical protein KA050_03570, partial [Candidatus Gracilibacteria bacterium]|nr:hypothetical protein [Candidatus Gracilibacteria bacterium]
MKNHISITEHNNKALFGTLAVFATVISAVAVLQGPTPKAQDLDGEVRKLTGAFSTSLVANLPIAASFTDGPLVLHDLQNHRTITIHGTGERAHLEIVSDNDPNSKMVISEGLVYSHLKDMDGQRAVESTLASLKAGMLI